MSKSSSVYFVGLVEIVWGMPSYIYLHTISCYVQGANVQQ